MLLAHDITGKLVNAKNANRNEKYSCPDPDCKNTELILRYGMVRIPHFAHMKHSGCTAEYEKETDLHVAAKLFFQEKLSLPDTCIEYGKIKGVRPDVLYKDFAIEIQCSSITPEEVKRRNDIYKANNLIPLWFFKKQKFATKYREAYEFFSLNYPIIYSLIPTGDSSKLHTFYIDDSNELPNIRLFHLVLKRRNKKFEWVQAERLNTPEEIDRVFANIKNDLEKAEKSKLWLKSAQLTSMVIEPEVNLSDFKQRLIDTIYIPGSKSIELFSDFIRNMDKISFDNSISLNSALKLLSPGEIDGYDLSQFEQSIKQYQKNEAESKRKFDLLVQELRNEATRQQQISESYNNNLHSELERANAKRFLEEEDFVKWAHETIFRCEKDKNDSLPMEKNLLEKDILNIYRECKSRSIPVEDIKTFINELDRVASENNVGIKYSFDTYSKTWGLRYGGIELELEKLSIYMKEIKEKCKEEERLEHFKREQEALFRKWIQDNQLPSLEKDKTKIHTSENQVIQKLMKSEIPYEAITKWASIIDSIAEKFDESFCEILSKFSANKVFNEEPNSENIEKLTDIIARLHTFIGINGKDYMYCCKLKDIIRQTEKAYQTGIEEYIPKSLSIIKDNYLYCPEWLWWKKKERSNYKSNLKI